ncbi:hypothetical protein DDB_G0268272 [Dictyostelium discoideum AX4]|uniref:AMP-dependent synthetase/ligase domain-containing protein n=1 Tax=Dictyostelium discoideum TaxID=44689 RepID=Q55GS0_DICDI|nr:hypothetical protein DDB_G0268272 [Dictyostelium discoideum AX4]EAL73589.2 hypothetical protein DDB_G0268272 [Dictyostelium discoideum AX4]|eukprot:XP_647114.2 hypothetical protein DDB_G0268272 [Dictyostelium discoideum AX4]
MYKLSDPFNYKNDSNYANNKPNEFWDEVAKKNIYWDKIYDKVYSGDEIYPDWFQGGKFNSCYNVLDINVNNPLKRDQVAIIYECPYLKKTIELTYNQLFEKVCEFSRVLLNLNITKDDNVLICMAPTLEPIIAMLSCARIGATHCVIYDSYSINTLVGIIEEITPKLILSSNFTIINDTVVEFTTNLKNAIEISKFKPNHVITDFRNHDRNFNESDLKFIQNIKPIPNCLNWDNEINKIKENQQKPFYEYVPVDSNHPLYILHTSGTTGIAKSIVRSNGSIVCLKYNYSTMIIKNLVLRFHSHYKIGGLLFHGFLYGYLSNGQTIVLGEIGETNFWNTLEKHKISISFVCPRKIKRQINTDPNAENLKSKYNLSNLRVLCFGGEPTDPSLSDYIENKIKVKCSRGYGQTEIGITYILGYGHPNIPYSACGVPAVFIKPVILSPVDGKELSENEIGEISFKLPMPPSFATTFYKKDEKFKQLFSKYKGYYNSGDLGFKDNNGYFSVISRIEDQLTLNDGKSIILNKIESSILKHPLVLECCSFALENLNQLVALLVLKNADDHHHIDMNHLKNEINLIISNDFNPSTSLSKIIIIPELPISINGKIIRSVISKFINNSNYQLPENIGDLKLFYNIKNLCKQ